MVTTREPAAAASMRAFVCVRDLTVGHTTTSAAFIAAATAAGGSSPVHTPDGHKRHRGTRAHIAGDVVKRASDIVRFIIGDDQKGLFVLQRQVDLYYRADALPQRRAIVHTASSPVQTTKSRPAQSAERLLMLTHVFQRARKPDHAEGPSSSLRQSSDESRNRRKSRPTTHRAVSFEIGGRRRRRRGRLRCRSSRSTCSYRRSRTSRKASR